MTEKKTLTEEQLNKLSEEQLTKVSGGYTDGQICPQCNRNRVVYAAEYYGLHCYYCDWTCRGAISDFE